MTDMTATVPDKTATATAPVNPVSQAKVSAAKKSPVLLPPKAKAAAPAPKPAAAPAPVRAKHPIVRAIGAGSRIDPDAILTMNVDNPCTGVKNHVRWEAGYPKKGQSATVRDILAIAGGPTVGDLRYGFERAWLDIEPAPAKPKK
jgi:hypothetical protein